MSIEPAAPSASPAVTGGRRDRTTRKSVLIKDKIADWTITVGGMAVILAVAGIMVFLVQVVVPLFTGGEVGHRSSYALSPTAQRALGTSMDEYKTIAAMVMADGRVVALHASSGKPIEAPAFDFGGATATAFGSTLDQANVAFGFGDGSVRFGELKMVARVIPGADLPSGLTRIDDHDSTDGHNIYRKLPGNQVRVSSVEVTLEEPQRIPDEGAGIIALDYRVSGGADAAVKSFVTVDAVGVVRLTRAESKRNMLTRKLRTTVETSLLPSLPPGTVVEHVALTEKADQVFVSSGNTIFRYDTRNFEAPVLAETARVLPEGARITAFGFLIGEQSIVVGGSNGAVDVYFRLPRPAAQGSDGYELVRAHRLEPQSGAVVGLSASLRGKTFATLDGNGNVWLRHSTSEQTLIRFDGKSDRSDTVVLAPRANGILSLEQGRAATLLDFEVPHPETTLATIFGKAWYEGYDGPTYTWQSSSGTDSFEPKFSLIPLIFGTLKATVYSLLFAIPIALLGAIYTAEFLDGSVRAVVKPAMEMMASLPSVVLGFIAALILAPIVETWIGALILAFVLVPLALVAGAYLWQLLPLDQANRLSGVPKLGFQFTLVALVMFLAYSGAPQFELLFFGGDFKGWINGQSGNAAPFLFLVLSPISFGMVAWMISRFYGERIETLMLSRDKTGAALLDLGRWGVILVGSVLLAFALAQGLTALGVDARGGVIDTYVQRNTLVVGFAMGFAVIPLIYTLADDALTAVPEHLRAASLACGATQWQTSIRIILPTAISGVFAAIMIGMGRAVGETMIVVMAAGNTALIDWNLFNGLRALSANIAVELPEAVKDDTLYRVLFLAALTLFAMTFVINTAAEVVRQRFRKRSVQL